MNQANGCASPIRPARSASKYDQKDTVRRLGLSRLGQTVEQPDNPHTGMIHKVRHLVTVMRSTGRGKP